MRSCFWSYKLNKVSLGLPSFFITFVTLAIAKKDKRWYKSCYISPMIDYPTERRRIDLTLL